MWRVYALLGTVTVIAGLTPIAARMATAELPPLTMGFVRFGTAGVLLVLTTKLLGLTWSIPREWRGVLIALGALCVPINQVGFLCGVKLANASHAGIAYALAPVLVFWISLAMGRTSLSRRVACASLLAFVGAAVVVLATGERDTAAARSSVAFIVGDILLLSAAASWALFSVLSQPVVKKLGAIQTLTAVFLIGAVLHLPIVAVDYLYFDLGRFDWGIVTWRGVAGFAFITLITAYLNYLLWYVVIARYDVTRSTIVTNAFFLITVLAEAVFFDQRLSWWVAPGSLVLFAGIALATYVPQRARNTRAWAGNA